MANIKIKSYDLSNALIKQIEKTLIKASNDSEMYKILNRNVPMDSGDLQESLMFSDNTYIWRSPYARRQHYDPKMYIKNVNKNPYATALWLYSLDVDAIEKVIKKSAKKTAYLGFLKK